MTRRLTVLATLVIGSAAAIAPAAEAGSAAGCRTPRAADGHEPPCNPALAASPWPGAHRNNYAQASSPFDAPRPRDEIAVGHTTVTGAPIFMGFTSRYPDGGRNAWMSALTAPEVGMVLKVDAATGEIIDTYNQVEDEGELPTTLPSVSGAYNLVDADNHLIVGRAQRIDVHGDSVPGDRHSPIALLARLELPDRALCRDDDRLVGITMLPNGKVAFATELGIVGVVPRQPDRITASRLKLFSLNGSACGDQSVDADELEQISNSIAGDERNAIYVVTSEAHYKLRESGGKIGRVWRARYETSTATGGARLGAGSGSTPTLMGTEPGDDRFVVITDGQRIAHMVFFWRDRIPEDWKPIAPGKPRRMACEVPITFGDPEATQTNSEQSVLVRGYGAVEVNNQLALDAAFAALPQGVRPLAVLTGQVPGNEPHGAQRIDWNPRTRTCKTRWANPDVSIPNGVPTMSSKTGLFYGIGIQNGTWGLSGLDFDTGEEVLFQPSTPLPDDNSFFAGTTVGPGGTVWTGTLLGITVFRPG